MNTLVLSFIAAPRNLSFTKNSAAPAASPAAPPSSCALVAPASISSDTAIASTGTTGPNGITNVAGLTLPSNRLDAQPERRRTGAGVVIQPGDRTGHGQYDERSRQRKAQRHQRREDDALDGVR